MLNPVSQLSMAIRENTEQLTEKIKYVKFGCTSDKQGYMFSFSSKSRGIETSIVSII